MVNTQDILEDELSSIKDAKIAQGGEKGDEKLDDIMLAMDVVDTLRHERVMVEKELAGEDRREALIERLRGIYQAQGIDVPDEVLMDGVMALEDQRFVYEPPTKGFGTSVARLYVNRRKWLPLFYTLGFVFIGAFGINYFGFDRPQMLENKRIEKLLDVSLPQSLKEAQTKALSTAGTEDIKARINDLYALGTTAIENKNVTDAKKHTSSLEALSQDLSQRYTLRVVSRPGEYSGVFRINEDGATAVRNYYLIVEGISPSGERLEVLINSEEDQKTRRTTVWGVRVPEAEFNKIAADKRDDQIIQNSVIGEKKRGFLDPEYSVQTSGGRILDW